jgi:hypothetical protein
MQAEIDAETDVENQFYRFSRRVNDMDYEELFYLKYKKGISTYELLKRFPESLDEVADVALMDVPETTLKEIIPSERDLVRLMQLKRRFSNFF